MQLFRRNIAHFHTLNLGKRRLADTHFSPLSLAPYERRVIELLRNSKDKRARKLAKKRVRISFAQL
jgi:hypothetical protein